MDVVASLIANCEPAVLRKPGQRALHNPPVSSQLLAALYPLSCYSALYPAPSQSSLALLIIVGFVGMQFLGTPPRPTSRTPDGLYSIDKLFEDHRVVDVRGCEHYREWDAPSVRNKVALRALLSFIRRIRSGFRAPFWQGWKPNRVKHAPTLSGRPPRDGQEELGAASPTPRPLAIPSSVASKSCPSRMPSLGAASPRGYRSLARRRCP
jgi:hypothetical protein